MNAAGCYLVKELSLPMPSPIRRLLLYSVRIAFPNSEAVHYHHIHSRRRTPRSHGLLVEAAICSTYILHLNSHRCRRDRHLPRTQPRAAHLALTPTCQQPKYNSLPLSALSPEIRVTHGAVTRPASAAARPTRVIKSCLRCFPTSALSLCAAQTYICSFFF